MSMCKVTVVYVYTAHVGTRIATSDPYNSFYQSSGSAPKEVEFTSSESTVSLLDRLKAPTQSELSRELCVRNGEDN